ncbi:MAG: DUF3710 domain-containing protein [Micromonosporaceae bacterium]|nr:DUF3710 domain-containing protein [Micromonosporaceae bacterium]
MSTEETADEAAEAVTASEEHPEAGATTVPPQRAPGVGPFDIEDAPSTEQFLDLGALRIPMVEGVEVRVQADPEGRVQQIALIAGDNGLQLAVLAAPRTEPIWDEIRAEIRAQLRSDGFASQETAGEYGPELRTRVRTPDGPTDLRFVGISGPRWLVRAIYQGPVALDLDRAPVLTTCLRGLVVDRGGEAMPSGDILPLRLPKEIAEQAAGGSPAGGSSPGEGAERRADASTSRRRQHPRRR